MSNTIKTIYFHHQRWRFTSKTYGELTTLKCGHPQYQVASGPVWGLTQNLRRRFVESIFGTFFVPGYLEIDPVRQVQGTIFIDNILICFVV